MDSPPVYRKLVSDMGFDPEKVEAIFGPPDNWDLHPEHPVEIMNRVRELAALIGWDQTRLEEEYAWLAWWDKNKERGEDGNEPTRPPPEADGRAGSEAGGGTSKGETGDPGTPGAARADQGDQAGSPDMFPADEVRRLIIAENTKAVAEKLLPLLENMVAANNAAIAKEAASGRRKD